MEKDLQTEKNLSLLNITWKKIIYKLQPESFYSFATWILSRMYNRAKDNKNGGFKKINTALPINFSGTKKNTALLKSISRVVDEKIDSRIDFITATRY